MYKKVSRRDFLRMSALTAASAALAGCACETPPPPPATSAPTEAPATAEPTPVPEATPVPPTEAPALSVKESLEAIGFLPGAPDHEKGWETILPLVQTPPDAEPIVVTGNKRVEVGDELISDETATSPFWQIGMELFNIDWQVAWSATAEDMNTKYSLAMASGELTDWMEEIPQTVYVNMLEADMLEDITDAWDAAANPTWMKKPVDSYLDGNAAWSYAKVDGRIMAFPMAERAANNAKLLFARQDWLDQLDLSMPETLDEVKEVALAFKEANLGPGDVTLGLNLSRAIGRGPSWKGDGWFASADAITGAFGVQSAWWLKDGAGGLVQGDILPAMKDALLLLREWYADGVIPEDFFTVPDGDAMGRSGGNLAGLHFAPAWGARWPIEDSLTNDPEAVWTWGRIPTGPGGKRGSVGEMPYWVINGFRKGFEHVDRVIECFNWWVELWEDPEKRFHGWDGYLSGDSQTGFAWDGNTIITPEDPPAGRAGFGPHFMRGGTYMDTYAMANSFAAIESWKDIPEDERDAMQQYLLEDPLGTISEYRRAYVFTTGHESEDNIFNEYLGLPTEGMQAYQTTLDGLRDEVFYGIITGDKPPEAFDDFVDQWKAQGGDQITQEVNDWYKSR
jgi:putative aldouronate transport system substrate-binding protein